MTREILNGAYTLRVWEALIHLEDLLGQSFGEIGYLILQKDKSFLPEC